MAEGNNIRASDANNKEAYTAAPLQNLEHEADAFDPSDDEDDCVVAPSSVVVPADHGHGRGDGGP